MSPSLLLGIVLAVTATPRFHLSALDWESENVSADRILRYASHLNQALRSDGIEVLTQSELVAVLDPAAGAELKGCGSAVDCLSQLGNVSGIDGILTAKVSRLDEGGFRAQLQVLSPDQEKVLATATAEGRSDEQMLEALDRAAVALNVGLETQRPTQPLPPPSVSQLEELRRGHVPTFSDAIADLLGTGDDDGLAVRSSPYLEEQQRRDARLYDFPSHRGESWGAAGVGIGAAAIGASLMPKGQGVMFGPGPGGIGLSGRW